MPGQAPKLTPVAPDSHLSADGVALPELPELRTNEVSTQGTLFLVATPIGCLEDITIRALRILRTVSIIAAEHPAVARPLLAHYEISTPVVGIGGRADDKAAALVGRLLAGSSVALVCDAGTPLIADAGFELAASARRAGVTVRSVPGPCAAIAALVLSSAATTRFAFDGFPPRTRSDRPAYFRSLAKERRTIVLYETLARFFATHSSDFIYNLGSEAPEPVARDLTKPTETLFHGSLEGAVLQFTNPPRGEYVVIVAA